MRIFTVGSKLFDIARLFLIMFGHVAVCWTVGPVGLLIQFNER